MPQFDGSPDWFARLFLTFFFYSICGWGIETVYCSVKARRFIKRGFLHGPYCPIYGGGVLLMLFVFTPLARGGGGRELLFFLVATLVLSTWEYLVGWFLELTTGVKYWDYSDFKFHLNGRITPVVCLCWGGLAFVVVYLIHPAFSAAAVQLSFPAMRIVALVCACVFFTDVGFTIHRLALITKLYKTLERVARELRARVASGLDPDGGEYESAVASLRARYEELIARAEGASRLLRRHYPRMSSRRYPELFRDVQNAGAAVRDRILSVRSGGRKDGSKTGSDGGAERETVSGKRN